jgi:hypothetical protein
VQGPVWEDRCVRRQEECKRAEKTGIIGSRQVGNLGRNQAGNRSQVTGKALGLGCWSCADDPYSLTEMIIRRNAQENSRDSSGRRCEDSMTCLGRNHSCCSYCSDRVQSQSPSWWHGTCIWFLWRGCRCYEDECGVPSSIMLRHGWLIRIFQTDMTSMLLQPDNGPPSQCRLDRILRLSCILLVSSVTVAFGRSEEGTCLLRGQAHWSAIVLGQHLANAVY